MKKLSQSQLKQVKLFDLSLSLSSNGKTLTRQREVTPPGLGLGFDVLFIGGPSANSPLRSLGDKIQIVLGIPSSSIRNALDAADAQLESHTDSTLPCNP